MSRLIGKTFGFCLVFLSSATLLETVALATQPAIADFPDPSETISPLASIPQKMEATPTLNAATDLAPFPIPQTPVSIASKSQNRLTQVQPLADSSIDSNSMSQVTSVSQLSDVQPTDWAFPALQSLVERYACIAGYPDGTFRGNRSITRYEFAAGVNACLDQINRVIAQGTANYVTKDDLAVIQRLQEEFAAELSALRGRVDALESRTSELEANQFSTTTKLNGETIWAISDTFGKGAVDEDNTTTNFGYQVRLNFDTSFSGKDLLRTRLQARNNVRYDRVTGTPMTRTNFDGDEGSQVLLDKLTYRFPVGDRTTVEIGPKGLAANDAAPLLNPYLAGSLDGALSRFGAFNPAIFNTPGDAGITVNHQFGDAVTFSGSYLVNTPANPTPGNGLFNGSYGALAQLTFFPNNPFSFALSYVRSYSRQDDVNLSVGTGSVNANAPFGQDATQGNHYGVEASWQVSPRFALAGWVGYVDAQQLSGGDAKAGIWNGAIALAFPDLFKEGNLGGIIVGVPPKVTHNDIKGNQDNATSLHVEALYRFQVSDFISVTPGFYLVTNTDHDRDNDTTWVGVLRTSFTF